MTIPLAPTVVEVAYYTGFAVLRDKIMVLHRKQIEKEKVSGKGDDLTLQKLAIHHTAIGYTYLLWWYATMAGSGTDQDIAFWKTEYDYDEIKACMTEWGIELDTVLDAILGITNNGSSSIPSITGSSGIIIPGPFKSDYIAGINGVLIGQTYQLSADNVYGMKEGALTVRVGNSN